MRQHSFGVFIKLHQSAVAQLFFKRVQNDRARFVVLNSDYVWRLRAAVVTPFDVAGDYVLGALQPFETDHRRCSRFDFAGL